MLPLICRCYAAFSAYFSLRRIAAMLLTITDIQQLMLLYIRYFAYYYAAAAAMLLTPGSRQARAGAR